MTSDHRRARDLVDFDGTPGPWNAITDVPGVEVGYTTLIDGDGPLVPGEGPVRTGVTAILPLGHEGVGTAVAAGMFSFNGNGELTGSHWVEESGSLALPVAITNTHAVGPVHRGVLEWSLAQNPALQQGWHLPVVGETFDGYLNDINGRHVREETAITALDAATSGPLAEGSVGGGTGMNCYGFKGGTGTASRAVTVGEQPYVVGILTQANFGSREELTIRGRQLGRQLADDNPMETSDWLAPPGSGSCITMVATDAPLLPGQCKALARRVSMGLARTGTTGSHVSGDVFLAFSTANAGALDSGIGSARTGWRQLDFLPWPAMNVLYDAVVRATEEAVVNALVAAETMIGRDGHRSPGFPNDVLGGLRD
ncbi:aminopeptidase [Flexivirga endophytica]|uniref:Aminopeptidase n=1 Tax=Flexivirga endophytica TaxID=1849103 RepID=A0A916T584_9MICO|nr:P1 family peptidase [Flexivirga endophytica]GGB32340.1 aminopeptidase [Flexivirga endophytica]GHB53224.1 aminopeptidase [Flexivirga endophytica]